MKYRFNGKEKLLSFGKYPDVSLKEARERAQEARKCLSTRPWRSEKGEKSRYQGRKRQQIRGGGA